jgi:hypothetical protein
MVYFSNFTAADEYVKETHGDTFELIHFLNSLNEGLFPAFEYLPIFAGPLHLAVLD